MSKPKLFVALPTTHGVMASRFLEGVMDLFRDHSYDRQINQYIDPYIVLARNTAAADFLQTDCTHLLFIDADIIFVKEHVARLLSHDVDIVGGLYCKKAEGAIKWVCNALPERPEPDERGLIRLRHIGTGFMMIKRVVFEKMINYQGYPMRYCEDETDRPLWNFFRMPMVYDEKGVSRVVSEDWNFCNVARDLGFTIYGDTHVLLKHIGSAVFPLKTQVAESKHDRNPRLA
jgi:hypothetical protein